LNLASHTPQQGSQAPRFQIRFQFQIQNSHRGGNGQRGTGPSACGPVRAGGDGCD
jgi:hypothetical protein